MVDNKDRYFMPIDWYCPYLLEYCENCGCVDDDGSEAIKSVPIDDVCPDIFGHLLYYVYGGTVSDKVLQVRTNRLPIL